MVQHFRFAKKHVELFWSQEDENIAQKKLENIIQDKEDTSLYWIGENGKEAENGPGTDFYAIRNNYVSITPLQIDLTNNDEIEKVDNWIKKIN